MTSVPNKRKSFPAWTDAENMLSTPIIPHRIARLACPPLMALCVAGLPTCLYFAATTDKVGVHLGLVITALFLLTTFCLALRLLLAPIDATHVRARMIARQRQRQRRGQSQRQSENPGGQGGYMFTHSPHTLSHSSQQPVVEAYALDNLEGGDKVERGTGPVGSTKGPGGSGVRGGRAGVNADTHLQGEIGRW